MKTSRLLAAVFILIAAAARAGTFSTDAWTNDASTGIASGQTSWANHFGSATDTTVNGVTVTGIAAAPVSNTNFDLAAPTPEVFNNDTNNLTGLTGTGSAVIAKDFVYSNQSAGVMSVTVKGLTAGSTYTVTFLSVGWEAAGSRLLTFASGADSRSVDQDQFGDNNGIRIDYTFTATAATRLITLTPQNASFRFHLYGLALRPETAPTTVTTTADSGPGSLRWALVNAADRSGPDTVTFAPALSGQTIALGSEIDMADTGDVTVDASSLPGGITVSGGNARRLLYLDSGTIATFRAVTFTGGNAVGSFDSGRGGAIYGNNATLTLDRCTLNGNTASGGAGDGGVIFVNFGTISLTNCTLTANSAGWRGGAIFNKGTLTLTHCTVTGNSASSDGGGIYNEFVGCTLNYSIVSGNTAGRGAEIFQNGGTLTRVGMNLVSSLAVGTDLFSGAALTGSGTVSNAAPNLGALASNGGPTKTMLPDTGSPAINAAAGSTTGTDQRGLSRPQGGTADIGAAETVPSSGLVVQNNADSGPGSLRQTLADAALSPGADILTFAPGLSGQTITLTSGQLTLSTDVTIDASALASAVVISGNSNGDNVLDPGESRIFDIPAGVTVVLRRLNLINGIANPADNSTNGQGGAIRSSGQLTVDLCTISACRAANGGGIFCGGTLTLTQSTLSGNTASDNGGGIHSIASTLAITRSTLSGNSAISGGGIICANTVTLTQSTLSGNSASSDGGGISNFGTLTVTQSTLSGNSASSSGGGIFNPTGTLTLNRSIVAGNTATSSPNISGSFSGPNNLTSGDPLLAPLGNYGGPTQTMPPLPGSPAIDAGGSTTDTTDQRGAPRVADGDGNGSAIVDIGAVEVTPALVTSLTDSGAGSLRTALADPFTSTVFFAPALTGGTLTLTTGQLTLSRSVAIDASAVTGGLTISGNSNGDNVLDPGESRIFDIPAGVTVVLRRLNLINGIANPADNSAIGSGGAIRSSGQLTVDQCIISACRANNGGGLAVLGGGATLTQSTLSGNSASVFGGGIFNDRGTLTVTQSTLSGNSASIYGGGIFNDRGTLTVTQSTLSGNSSSGGGGGIFNDGGTTLTQSTLSGNSSSGGGGGIINNGGTLNLTRSIVAGNTAPDSANIRGTSSGTNNLIDVDPLLAPLGNYGGPTQTMPPLPGSPAIDAGGSTTDTTDQRGAPRVADGGGNGSTSVDIGAVEVTPAIVTSLTDSGAGSLRSVLTTTDPFVTSVLFDPALSGGTLTLTSGQLTPSRSLGIDATLLPAGLTLSGNSNGDNTLDAGESRLFEIPAGVAVVLRGLHLTNGIADPASNSATGEGGAIRNSGQLTLDLCTLSNCRSRRGGAINSTGVLTVGRSTFQQNSATFGGAIHSTDNGLLKVADSTFLMNTAGDRGGAVLENDVDSPAGHPTLTRCTFHGNAAARGGAVYSFSLTNLTHCTISANSASNIGGGVQASSSSVVTLTNCVVSGNANAGSPDLGFDSGGVLSTAGVNLVRDFTGSGLSATATLLTGDPLLAPIADYGGPTQTRALLPGSPARNAATVLSPAQTADQRGFPMVGTPDLGAYEAGTLSSFGAFAAETPGPALSPTGDADGDGRSDLLEYATMSDPHAASSSDLTPTTLSKNATGAITQANVNFQVRLNAADLIYTLQRSTSLGSGTWTTVATYNGASNLVTVTSPVSASINGSGLVSVSDPGVAGMDKAFYRVQVSKP